MDRAEPAAARRGRDAQGLRTYMAKLDSDTRAVVGDLDDAWVALERYTRNELSRRPYVALGTAAAVGYVLGGGLPTRLTRWLFRLGTSLALDFAARELTSRPAADKLGPRER